MATGDSSVHQQLSHGGFGWDEGRQTHSPPDPRENRTLREEDHTWRAGHDTEDGGRYEEQPEARTVCHRQGDEDSGETTQPEERPSIGPWRRQATNGYRRENRGKVVNGGRVEKDYTDHFLCMKQIIHY